MPMPRWLEKLLDWVFLLFGIFWLILLLHPEYRGADADVPVVFLLFLCGGSFWAGRRALVGGMAVLRWGPIVRLWGWKMTKTPVDAIILAVAVSIAAALLSTPVVVVLAAVGTLPWGSTGVAVMNSAAAACGVGFIFGIGVVLFGQVSGRPLAIAITAVVIIAILSVCVIVPVETGKQSSQLIWNWTIWR